MQGADSELLTYTSAELVTLVDWLEDFGFAIAKAEAAIQRAADAEAHSGRASVVDPEDTGDPLPSLEALRRHVVALHEVAGSCFSQPRPMTPLVRRCKRNGKSLQPSTPCWDASCGGRLHPDSILCFACARINPATAGWRNSRRG